MALIDSYNLSLNPDFRGRVKVAISMACTAIVGEAVTPGKEAKHAKRHSLGQSALLNPNSYLDPFVNAVVSNPVITLGSPDADIQFTVISVFDDLAGVTVSEA